MSRSRKHNRRQKKNHARTRKLRPFGLVKSADAQLNTCPCCSIGHDTIDSFRGAERARVRVETQAMSTLTTTDYGPHAFGHLDCTKRELAQFNFDTPWIPELCDCGDREHDDPRDCILADEEYNWFDEYMSMLSTVTV